MKFLEIGVKPYTDEIDSRKTFLEGLSNSSDQWKLPDSYVKIEKFPAEFKKNIFKTFDRRFFYTLLFSIFLNISTILILKNILPSEVTQKTIHQIQQQYAKLLVDNELNISSYSYSLRSAELDYRFNGQLITGLNKWMDTFTDKILESIKDIPALDDPALEFASKETMLPSKEELGLARESAMEKRLASRTDLEREVNSVGLLGLISSNVKSIDYEYVQDLLEYASENSTHLAEVLAKLNSIEVPRYGSSGYLRKIRKREGSNELGELKGGRISVDDEVKKIIEDVEPLKPVKTTSMKRNVQYEEVSSSYLDKLSNPNINSKTRSAQDVLKVVQSHTRALQDCYKQELRYDPNINGKIVVRFRINPDGIVTNASIISSTLNSPRMEECILNRIKRWKNFPPCDPSIGENTYRQSFTFGERN